MPVVCTCLHTHVITSKIKIEKTLSPQKGTIPWRTSPAPDPRTASSQHSTVVF